MVVLCNIGMIFRLFIDCVTYKVKSSSESKSHFDNEIRTKISLPADDNYSLNHVI